MFDDLLKSTLAIHDDPLAQITIFEVYEYVTGLSARTHKFKNDYIVRCPVADHADAHPSCQLNSKNNTWKCYSCGKAGGKLQMVILGGKAHTKAEAAIFLRTSSNHGISAIKQQPRLKQEHNDIYSERLKNEKLVSTHDYNDIDGKLLYQVLRYEGEGVNGGRDKRFIQRKPGENGKWIYNIRGVKNVPYRLKKILEAGKLHKPVLVVEGEKIVDVLEKLGFYATTNAIGSVFTWPLSWLPYFDGVYAKFILPDADKPGRRTATQRAKLLNTSDSPATIVDLFPNCTDGEDVLDLLQSKEYAKLTKDQQKAKLSEHIQRLYNITRRASLPK